MKAKGVFSIFNCVVAPQRYGFPNFLSQDFLTFSESGLDLNSLGQIESSRMLSST